MPSTSWTSPGGGGTARRGQGHRIIIAHIFLPDTIEFQEESDGEVFTPLTDDPSASTSPVLHPINPPLPLHELPDRLESHQREVLQKERETEKERKLEDERAKELQKQVTQSNGNGNGNENECTSTISISRSNSTSKRRSSRPPSFSSSNEARKINMSSLINEASQGQSLQGEIDFIDSPSNLVLGSSPRSRRGSPSGSRPIGFAASSRNGSGGSAIIESDIPAGVVSDHGRSATIIDSNSTPNVQSPIPTVFATSPSPKPSAFLGPIGATSSQPSLIQRPLSPNPRPNMTRSRTSTNVGLAKPRSRRGSGNTNGPSGMALTQVNSSGKDGDQLTGTKTPGAKAGGRAGLMTPLSIIGDLAVSVPKRSAKVGGRNGRTKVRPSRLM